MVSPFPPRDRRGFEVALICALPLEAECVQAVFDKFWEDAGKKYGKAAGDPNTYSTGVIGEHNVVLAYMPGMGSHRAAAVAGAMKVSFPNIKLALIIEVCGGMPFDNEGNEILLGDVIISQALIQYDFGRQYPTGFKKRDTIQDSLSRPSPEIRAVQARLGTDRYKQGLHHDIAMYLQQVHDKLPDTKPPGREGDVLYPSSYTHQHHTSVECECDKDGQICAGALSTDCEDLGCEAAMRISRSRLVNGTSTQPLVHFGVMGSANTVMKSGQHRDDVAKTDGIVAFEMEGAGVWDYFPSVVIKGVCDYADSHKRKGWQRYAAATAAACTKAFLKEWTSGNGSALKAYFHVPRQRVAKFFGREEELERISSFFENPVGGSRILILHALGGQGKSQIALEYCERSREAYSGIFWINGTSTSTLTQSLIGIAQELDNSAVEALSNDDAKVKLALTTLEQWDDPLLLVFDNCDDPTTFSDLERYTGMLASSVSKGDVLVTSRHRGLEELGTIVEIPPMPENMGVSLLLRRYPEINVADHLHQGSKIVARLGGLALAIEQASAYMAYMQWPIDKLGDFLAQYEKHRKDVLRRTADYFWKYTKIDESGQETAISAFTTWEMSFRQLIGSSDQPDSVAHFLTLAAFLAPIHVGETLFQFHWEITKPSTEWVTIFLSSLGSNEESSSSVTEEAINNGERKTNSGSEASANVALKRSKDIWDAELFWRLIRQAYQMSLLQSVLPPSTPDGAAFMFHPLIRDWLQLRVHSSKRQPYSHEAMDVLVSSIITYENRDSNAKTKRSMLLHMDATLLTQKGFLGEQNQLGKDITSCDNAGWFSSFYYDQGRFDASLDLLRTIVVTRAKGLGQEHIDTMTSMNNLATVLHDQGKYIEAEQMYREVLEARERVLDNEHPDTLTSMNNLAVLLCYQGKYAEAEQMSQEVVEVHKRVLGREHPDTLKGMNNLALVRCHQGKYTEAEQMYREVLQSRERVLGKEHPDTLSNISNLAQVLCHQRKYAEAEQMHREVLEAREKVLGKEHPETLESMNNIAAALSAQTKYQEAEQIQAVVVVEFLKMFAPNHPSSLAAMRILLKIWQRQGIEESERERALIDLVKDVASRTELLNYLQKVKAKYGRSAATQQTSDACVAEHQENSEHCCPDCAADSSLLEVD